MADTQWTTESGVEYHSKIMEAPEPFNKGVFIAAGEGGHVLIRKAWRNCKTAEDISAFLYQNAKEGTEIDMLWVLPDRVYYMDTSGTFLQYDDWVTAGSGSAFANAYLMTEQWGGVDCIREFAALAMKAAINCDAHTGGEPEVRWIEEELSEEDLEEER